jgi:hypothetical protein
MALSCEGFVDSLELLGFIGGIPSVQGGSSAQLMQSSQAKYQSAIR